MATQGELHRLLLRRCGRRKWRSDAATYLIDPRGLLAYIETISTLCWHATCSGSQVNIKQLRYFIAAVDAGNITRAARHVHVAQPALGTQLRELEQELGVVLLTRHSRGVSVTEAGQLLHERAKVILALLEQTRQELQELQVSSRLPLRLGVTTSVAMLVGTDLQLLANQAHPHIALTMVEAPSFSLADAVVREELDVALAYDVEEVHGISLFPVMQEELLFVRAKGSCTSGAPVNLQTVLSSRLAVGGRRDVARRALACVCGKSPAELPVTFEVQSVAAIRDLVVRGEATTVLPVGAIQADLMAGRVVAHRISDTPVMMTLYVVSRSQPSKAMNPSSKSWRPLLEMALALIAQKSEGYASPVHSPLNMS